MTYTEDYIRQLQFQVEALQKENENLRIKNLSLSSTSEIKEQEESNNYYKSKQ